MYYYYIIKIHDSLIKVGITKNLNQRLRAYKTSNPSLRYYKTYELMVDKKRMFQIEKAILIELRRWFSCRSETVECRNTRSIEIIVDGVMEELYNVSL